MYQRPWKSLATGILLVQCSLAAAAATPQIQVRTESGTVEGARFSGSQKDWMFLGIPYAAPPTNSRRWAPPQSPKPWDGVRRAANFGASCPQRETWAADAANYYSSLPGLEYYGGFHTSEDCLFVNVWSPNVGGAKLLPVVVWFHGGGNVGGSGSGAPLASALTSRGVVLVSFNYRLGTLGFMAHPALTAESPHRASGNYGLMDQIAAVLWVRRNIGAFGGDPNNVTVAGASSGSVDICRLMTSPLAYGLFRRAILQSGGCADYFVPELQQLTKFAGRNDSAEAAGVRLAHRLGVDGGKDVLARLRAKTVEEILKATDPDEFGSIGNSDLVDGYVIHEQPVVVFAANRQAAVPVLAGSNADESAYWSAEEAPKNLSDYQMWLQRNFAADWQTIFDAYPAKNDGDVLEAWEEMETDYETGISMFMLANAQRRIAQPAYLYYFTYPSKGRFPGRAYHGLEMSFLTKVFRGPTDVIDDRLAEIMGGYWTQFAKSGDPNGPGLPSWPAYDPRSNQVQELGKQVRKIAVPHLDRYAIFLKLLEKRLAERTPSKD